jgi:hypothetical protein
MGGGRRRRGEPGTMQLRLVEWWKRNKGSKLVKTHRWVKRQISGVRMAETGGGGGGA